jgi:hypothetical protein
MPFTPYMPVFQRLKTYWVSVSWGYPQSWFSGRDSVDFSTVWLLVFQVRTLAQFFADLVAEFSAVRYPHFCGDLAFEFSTAKIDDSDVLRTPQN